MKYLKQFETVDTKFNIGDYVRIKRGKCYPQYYKKIFELISLENEDLGGLWGLKPLIGNILDAAGGEHYLYFYTKDLVKATKKEVELFLLTNKFNL